MCEIRCLQELLNVTGGHTKPLYINSLTFEVCKRCAVGYKRKKAQSNLRTGLFICSDISRLQLYHCFYKDYLNAPHALPLGHSLTGKKMCLFPHM